MDELVKLVSQKTGLPEPQAKVAVETVLAYLKERLPEPLAGQLDNVLKGQGAGGLMGSLGGMFGG